MRCVRALMRRCCLVLLCGLAAADAAPAPELRLCMAESAALPAQLWRAAGLEEQGPLQIDVFTAALLGRQAGLNVQARVLPWRRCLLEVQMGRIDGVLGLSHTAERAQWAVFPMRAEQPDESLRLRRDAYHWYVGAGRSPRWDGQRLQGSQPLRLGSVAGYSVVDWLQQQGQSVETQTTSAVAALRMLALGRLDAAALLQGEVEPWLAREPALVGRVRRLDPPLLQRNYYLAFSQAFAQRQAVQLPRIWAALAFVRESPMQRRAEAELLARGS